MKTALIVVDIQNDYFAGGRFPLENSEQALAAALHAIAQARQAGELVVGIQHIAASDGPFMAAGTEGAALHPAIAEALQGCPVIEKHQPTASSALRWAKHSPPGMSRPFDWSG